MLLRSGRATSFGPRRRSGGISCGFDEAAAGFRPLKRKSPDKVDTAPLRQVRKSPQASSRKQLPVALHLPKVEAEILLSPPEVESSAGDGSNNIGEISDEASVAELGVKVFPDIPPQSAANAWVSFVNKAKACIKHYNTKYQADFVYKHAPECGSLFLEEPDGSDYYHINFHAQDKKGRSQLFFGEIMVVRLVPKEEDVTCCCPVSPNDAGGKRLATREEALNYKFPAWGTTDKDEEWCYGCYSVMKHPKGTCYVAGHVADPRHYFVP